MPPAFNLSQDQTLQLNWYAPKGKSFTARRTGLRNSFERPGRLKRPHNLLGLVVKEQRADTAPEELEIIPAHHPVCQAVQAFLQVFFHRPRRRPDPRPAPPGGRIGAAHAVIPVGGAPVHSINPARIMPDSAAGSRPLAGRAETPLGDGQSVDSPRNHGLR